jgi:CBS domain-containing protein
MHTIIRDLLKSKGQDIWSISQNATVLETLKLLAEKDIGALIVMNGEHLVGIISERDFVRSIAKSGNCLIHTEVKEYMTKEVITISPDKTIQDCMVLMTREHIRHLPVVENDHIVGMISIGDVVKVTIADAESRISNLEDFIEGRGYGH